MTNFHIKYNATASNEERDSQVLSSTCWTNIDIQRSHWWFVCAVSLQLCPTLCNHVDCSPPGSSVHGLSQARIPEWVAVSFSRGSFRTGHGTQVSCFAGRFFTIWATRDILAISHSLFIDLSRKGFYGISSTCIQRESESIWGWPSSPDTVLLYPLSITQVTWHLAASFRTDNLNTVKHWPESCQNVCLKLVKY